MQPQYSVLMSVYYKESPEFLWQSIYCILHQSIKPSDFVIVADGPLTPALDRILNNFAREYPHLFQIIRLDKNYGLGIALREGINRCKYELIARMDSDDYCTEDRIAKQLQVLYQHPDYDLVGTNVNEFMTSLGNVVSLVKLPETPEEIAKFAKKRCPFRHPSLLYKKSAVERAGNYRNFHLYEDYDLYIRLLRSGAKCYNIQEPLTYMRVSPDFYKRRGGFRYLKDTLRFKNYQKKTGYYTRLDYFKTTVPHVIVCLMPNLLRKKVYTKFLRKKAA